MTVRFGACLTMKAHCRMGCVSTGKYVLCAELALMAAYKVCDHKVVSHSEQLH